jgi:hypothetical protein
MPKPLSWQNFQTTVLVSGQQRIHRVATKPLVEIFGDAPHNRVGIVMALDDSDEVPAPFQKMTVISAKVITRSGARLIQISTDVSSLHRQFYDFAVAVARRVTKGGLDPCDALTTELQCFESLFAERSILSFERQLGLLGELLFLEELVQRHGAKALAAWIGPTGEPHDFRMADREFEVKTTSTPHRIHTINGVTQLLPSAGCELYLISISLGPPGTSNAFSLSTTAHSMLTRFSSPRERGRFELALHTAGFRQEDAHLYAQRFLVRRPMAAVAVDDRFPALTPASLRHALGSLASRLEALSYDVDVEGLESEKGSALFERII